MESLETILSEHPFFENLDERYQSLITGCAKNVRFEAGEFLFREGEAADQFYIIRHGKVALEMAPPNKPPMIIDTVDSGHVLGWSWLAPPYTWHFDAHALTLVRAITLDGKCLRNKIEQDHELGFDLYQRFFKVVTERLQHTRIQLMDVYGANV